MLQQAFECAACGAEFVGYFEPRPYGIAPCEWDGGGPTECPECGSSDINPEGSSKYATAVDYDEDDTPDFDF